MSARLARRRAAFVAVLIAVAVTSLARPAAAKLCGDAVDGHDVPCACGDVLASSVVLDGDPVTSAICQRDGLIVRAQDNRTAIRLDLHGHTLRGSGAGTGLRILDGGPGGASIVSSDGVATLEHFDDGITARGSDGVSLIQDVRVRDSRGDGVRISGRAFVIRRVVVEEAKRDGFSFTGAGFDVSETRASDCGRFGYSVMGNSGIIGRPGGANLAERNGTAGFNVMGSGHTLEACTARDGRKDGMALLATKLDVRDCDATGNAGDGVAGVGSRWQLSGNRADNNGGDGLTARGPGMVDAGGNRGADNRGGGRQRPAVQCEIGNAPCQP
ncbi:MAG: right-handed parallel beta-helix repeat-containing protein [bacterium]